MNAQDLSILSMITNASVLAQAVMALLLVISLVSWTIIFRKWFTIKSAQRATNRFEEKFWQGAELNALYQEVSHASKDPGPMARIFEAGMKEFRRARQNGATGGADASNVVLAPVAPGIAEALVATAIGLFAAIPAVVAYNRYAYEIERLANRFETFIDEFSNILDRHAR